MFTAGLLMSHNRQNWKLPKRPSKREWVNNVWRIHTMKCFINFRGSSDSPVALEMQIKKRNMLLLIRWLNLKTIHKIQRCLRGWRESNFHTCLCRLFRGWLDGVHWLFLKIFFNVHHSQVFIEFIMILFLFFIFLGFLAARHVGS